MNTSDKLNLDELGLEPIDGPGAKPSAQGKAKFQIDTRGGGDRRKAGERRQSIRFEEDRRKGSRRGKSSDPWEQSADL
ncbi:hypothetical protein [Pseudomonas sp. Q1-7]|uniref:hypothetical protein n=1 Tax=Pseudomonas sp. Q1-7 TaxID=3020843 RepID=UPI00230058D7|nr:hypothetical protein [Pseudomonas sp. Q1-7]